MDIRIESTQFPLAASLNRYLRRRIAEDLAFCRERVCDVRAYLSDTPTSYGRIDKCCRLVVRLMRGGEVTVQGVETDLFVAMRLAADRLQRGVSRRLRRPADPARLRAGTAAAGRAALPDVA